MWAPDVFKLHLFDVHSDELLGIVYCDFFARSNKNNHATHYNIQSGRLPHPSGGWDRQIPIVAIVSYVPSSVGTVISEELCF
jgi:intermediate peptidase